MRWLGCPGQSVSEAVGGAAAPEVGAWCWAVWVMC